MARNEDGRIAVLVCYALADRQTLIDVRLEPGATVAEAIAASGIVQRHPEIDLTRNRTGVFGKLRALDAPVAAGERIEIYRPLSVDPKLARQRRVAKTRAAGSVEGRKWANKDSR